MIAIIALKFNDGGIFMWVILAVLAVALAVSIERFIYYFIIAKFDGRDLVARIAKSVNSGDNKTAIKISEEKNTPLHILTKSALVAFDKDLSVEDIEEEVEQSAIMEIPKYSERLNYLSLFANVATLLGLLGTISGLQTSFSSLATHEAAEKAAMLANGISQAMNTTAFGLMVAVPCMVLYTMLQNQQKRIVRELDEAIVRLLSFLKKQRELA